MTDRNQWLFFFSLNIISFTKKILYFQGEKKKSVAFQINGSDRPSLSLRRMLSKTKPFFHITAAGNDADSGDNWPTCSWKAVSPVHWTQSVCVKASSDETVSIRREFPLKKCENCWPLWALGASYWNNFIFFYRINSTRCVEWINVIDFDDFCQSEANENLFRNNFIHFVLLFLLERKTGLPPVGAAAAHHVSIVVFLSVTDYRRTNWMKRRSGGRTGESQLTFFPERCGPGFNASLIFIK